MTAFVAHIKRKLRRIVMSAEQKPICPECEVGAPEPELGRREFFRWVGGGAASLAVGGAAVPKLLADGPANQPAPARAARPAEELIRELYQGLSDEQKQAVVYAWDHGRAGNRLP